MELVVGTDGGVKCVYDEAFDLRALGNCRSPRRAMWSRTWTATGGPTWGLLGGRCWGPSEREERRFSRRGGGSGGKPIIESQDPSHDGKKTDGGTLKNLARATMWRLVISRSPLRIAESVDCEIPTAFESAICL